MKELQIYNGLKQRHKESYDHKHIAAVLLILLAAHR